MIIIASLSAFKITSLMLRLTSQLNAIYLIYNLWTKNELLAISKLQPVFDNVLNNFFQHWHPEWENDREPLPFQQYWYCYSYLATSISLNQVSLSNSSYEISVLILPLLHELTCEIVVSALKRFQIAMNW